MTARHRTLTDGPLEGVYLGRDVSKLQIGGVTAQASVVPAPQGLGAASRRPSRGVDSLAA